jgi:hypothetical protein
VSDSEIRSAERTYRSSGNPADGEEWVQAVLRSTGLNSTFLIARVIETQRAIRALMNQLMGDPGVAMDAEIGRPVTPDDMVSFLRGGREWLNPPLVTNLTTPEDAAALRVVVGVRLPPGSTDGYQRARPALHQAQVGEWFLPTERPTAPTPARPRAPNKFYLLTQPVFVTEPDSFT